MQNYAQQPQGYQRPGSTTSFTSPAGPPPPYGVPQGYQTAAPQAQSQWAPPVQNQAPTQQWNQPQQAAGGYNPATYGTMPGGYSQGQQAPTQPSNVFSAQQQDVPPPPPPKPAGFVAPVQQQQQPQQTWGQQPTYGAQQPQQSFQSQQQNTGFSPQGQQGGYTQQGGFQNQAAVQQPYNNAAPPPPSQTPGGSYFPPTGSPQGQARPGSIYGADQMGNFSTPGSAGAQQPPSSVLSPNEQQPAYIPPSLTGQGVQSYMPANTNPMPGVYIPPPPDIPAWQQAQHAPLQGGKKFRYTKPTVDPTFYAQGYQGVQPSQPVQPIQPTSPQTQYGQQQMQPQQSQQQFGQPAQNQFQPQAPMQPQAQFAQPAQNQFPQAQAQQPNQFGQVMQPQQNQYGQPMQQQTQFPQQTTQYTQSPQGQPNQSPQQFQQQPNQWQPAPPVDQGFGQQQQQQNMQAPYDAQQPPQQPAWQPGHQAQGSVTGQQFPQGQDQGIQAPKPISGASSTTPPGFVNQPSPQSQPVSPVQKRQSMSFASSQNQTGLGRTGSVSSIALGSIHAQRAGNRTESPKPAPPKLPTPPPPRDHVSKFSALGAGGPSDWEHFGGAEEIDDEELFGAKETKENEPVQLDSVELPAQHPSPPSTQEEWPTPPNQPAGLTLQRRDTYQPTPPPKSTGTPAHPPPSQPPQQAFVMGDPAPPVTNTRTSFVMGDRPVPAAQTQTAFVMGDAPPAAVEPQTSFVMGDVPPPAGQSQTSFVMGDVPRPAGQAQTSFVMGNAIVAPSNTTQSPQPTQHTQPPPAQQSFVMGDEWAAPKQGTPVQPSQHPPPASNTFVMGDQGWGASQQTPTQATGGWGAQPSQAHLEELRAKDEAYELLKADAAREKDNFDLKIAELRAELDGAKCQAETEKLELTTQIESMKLAEQQSKTNIEASIREKDTTIERLKEDVEGKEETIKERDTTIADLRKKLKDEESQTADLRQQLQAEQSKEPPKPTPADLVPDIDPWYAGSLERFIAMLRGEAHEPMVEEKMKIFTTFLKAESGIRGIPYHEAPPPAPPAPAQEPIIQPEPSVPLSRGPSSASIRKHDLSVQVPQEQPPNDDPIRYSPGGRPIIQRRSTLKSSEPTSALQTGSTPGAPSDHSATVLTPTSSQDEDIIKTPTPMQSQPEEPQKYRPYVPPSVNQEDSVKLLHRQSISCFPAANTFQNPSPGQGTDEIFFETQPAAKPSSRPPTDTSVVSEGAIPAPLFAQATTSAATTPTAASKDPMDVLAHLIPPQITSAKPNPQLEEIRKKMTEFKPDFAFVQDLTTAWEKSAALARKKNDDARRRRQEESEAHTDQLFNDNEISYADIGAIEDEFKEKERELKAREDRDEYKSYVESVFDKVYDGLQAQIKSLMDLYIEAESLVQLSVSGVKSLDGSDVATTQNSLELLRQLNDLIEARHEKVVQAVAERDRRYRKTEIQPLYAAGNITKMKTVEKHFENAERQAVLRAKSEKAERVGDLVRLAEEVIVGAVGVEQQEIDNILAAIRTIQGKGDEALLTRAYTTLLALKASSKSLLFLFNDLEIELNTAVLEAEIAQARVENAPPERLKELEKEMGDGERRIRDEFVRKVGVVEQDGEEIERLVKEKGGVVGSGEEDETKARMGRALEEAKRRNGDL